MKNTIKALRTPALVAAALTVSLLSALAAPALSDGTVSPVQANVDPLGLPIVGL